MKKRIIPIILLTLLSSCSALRIAWDDGKKGENTVCLTFDDGPNGVATRKVLEVLDKYQLPATFFIIGQNAEREPELLKEISSKGYNIGNHSYQHDTFLFGKSQKVIEADILKTNRVIQSITGKAPILFRPPNAVINQTIENACKAINMSTVGVNIFVNDPMLFNANVTYNYVMKELKPGVSILVLHDGFGTFQNPQRVFIAEALDKIIMDLKVKGYKFGKLDNKGLCS